MGGAGSRVERRIAGSEQRVCALERGAGLRSAASSAALDEVGPVGVGGRQRPR